MPHEQFTSCIEACNACADTCDHCAAECLGEKDVAKLARCISMDLDCAAICRTTAGIMARGSELSAAICGTCAEVCDACAEECERHSSMGHCKDCAEQCRRCAEECRRMAGAAKNQRARPGAGAPAH